MAPTRQFRKRAPNRGSPQNVAPGAGTFPPLRISDAKLIENFLLATHDLPPSDVGRGIGEPPETILRWRTGGVRVAGEELRMRILTFLALRSMEARCTGDPVSQGPARELHGTLPVA